MKFMFIIALLFSATTCHGNEVPGFAGLQVRAWQNDGKGNFVDATKEIIPDITTGRSWSMAQGDMNGDGKTDIFIGSWGTQARLLLAQ